LVQNTCQLGGGLDEVPNEYIKSFLEICNTQKCDVVLSDTIGLMLFPFSIKNETKIWFYSLPNGTITTWDEMTATLMAKYLPSAKVSKLRSDIMTFSQLDDESIHDTWERYKVLLNKALNHGLSPWLEIQFFYNRLHPNTKMIIDIAAGGALMRKNLKEA